MSTREPEEDWPEQAQQAYTVLHNARPGDTVLFADRTVPMEVVETGTQEGDRYIDVDKPQADGQYRVKENYGPDGKPKFSSPIGRANDLHWFERQPEPRGLDETHYRNLVLTQIDLAIDTFHRLDYNDWEDAVEDVVDDWSDEVSFHDWRGYHHHPDWEEGDVEAIFESVIEHSTHDPDPDKGLKAQAEAALIHDVFERGRAEAEERMITSEEDYREIVDMLAHHSLDRFERKSYPSARVAVRDTVSQWIDDRSNRVRQDILTHADLRFDEEDYPEAETEEKLIREMAFDTVDHDTWEEVQAIQRDRGEHDPTARGLTFEDYMDLVDLLVKKTLRRHDRGFLRTTVKKVVNEWADEVQAEEWDGHRHRVYAAGDVKDIFSSVALHSETNPNVWNPFADDRHRKMAVKALVPEVAEKADIAMDENEMIHAEPIPADEYIQGVLGMENKSYRDIQDVEPEEMAETLIRITDAADEKLVGWTFADEIVEGGGVVPQSTNKWVLIDYGVLREGDTLRKLAWMDQTTGNVVILAGEATVPPDELEATEEPYSEFYITHHEVGNRAGQLLLEDATLDEALTFIYDFINADRADVRMIDTLDDGVFVQDGVTDEDLNIGGALKSIVPSPLWGTDDLLTLADASARKIGNTASFWGPQLKDMAVFLVMSKTPQFLSQRLDGIDIEPDIDKRKGVGIEGEYEFSDDSRGVTGEGEVEIHVNPGTISDAAHKVAPEFLKRGFDEGDLGKGALLYLVDKGKTVKQVGQYYHDPVVEELKGVDLKTLSDEEVIDAWERSSRSDSMVVEGESQTLDLSSANKEEMQAFVGDLYATQRFDNAGLNADRVTNRILADEERLRQRLWADHLRTKMHGYIKYAEPAQTWGEAFMEEFGSSWQLLRDIITKGQLDVAKESGQRRVLRNYLDAKPSDPLDILEEDQDGIEDIDVEETWTRMTDEERRFAMDYAISDETIRQRVGDLLDKDPAFVTLDSDPNEGNDWLKLDRDTRERILREEFFDELDDLTWEDLNNEEIGISGLVMRGLDAESLVDSYHTLDINRWVTDGFTFFGDDTDVQQDMTFEEWQQARYGPGSAPGPEEEARQVARFHKEIAEAQPQSPDPYEEIGTKEEIREQVDNQVDDAGDSRYPTGGFEEFVHDSFEEFEERFAVAEPVEEERVAGFEDAGEGPEAGELPEGEQEVEGLGEPEDVGPGPAEDDE